MKITVKRKMLLVAVVGLLAACPVAAKNTDKTSDSNINEEVSVLPERGITPSQRQILSDAAVKILRHIADARGAIHEKKSEVAKDDLKKVDSLVNIIKAGRPIARIKDHIWIAKKHLDYEDTSEVVVDLIPIYSSLTDIEDFVPVEQAKKNLDKAREHLKYGNKQAAKEELTAVDEAMTYTEIDLPLAETERQVALARRFLDQNNLQDADKALKAAEDGVQFLSVGVEGPLAQAHKSLWQASKNYTAKKYDNVKADLEKAAVWIDRAGQSSDKKVREEAVKLEHSLKILEDKMK